MKVGTHDGRPCLIPATAQAYVRSTPKPATETSSTTNQTWVLRDTHVSRPVVG